MNYKTWPGILLTLLIFLSVLMPVSVSAAGQKYSVLFLSSYTYSFATVPKQIEGLKSELSPENYDIDYEFMDTKRFSKDEDLDRYYDYLYSKLSVLPEYDAVVIGDDTALTFAMQHREELFPDTPMVFLGINSISAAEEAAGKPDVTGVIEKAAYQQNIDLIRNLFPDTKKIVAVTDDTQTGRGDQEQFKACAQANTDLEFDIIDASRLSAKSLAENISNVSDDSVILYLTLFEDKDGNSYSVDSGAKFIASNAKVPVFRLSIGGIGQGIFGGILISYEQMGADAGNIVKEILGGKSASDISLISDCPTYGLFDRKILDRYRINVRELPEGSEIINNRASFYQSHVLLCNMIILVLVFLFTIIAILMINLNRQKQLLEKQKKTEAALRDSQDTLKEAISNSNIQYFTYYPMRHRIEIYALNSRYSLLDKSYDNFPDSFIAFVKLNAEDERLYREMVNKIDQGEDMSSCTVQMLYNGVFIWVKVTMTAIKDSSGMTVKAQAFSVDITVQKREMDRYDHELLYIKEASEEGLITKGHINLSQNRIISYYSMNDTVSNTVNGMSYDEAYEFFIKDSTTASGEKPLAEIIERNQLIRRFMTGDRQFTVRYRRYLNGRAPVWMSTDVTMYTSPDTGDIECFAYTYDVTEKVLEEYIINKMPDLGYENIGFAYPQYGAVISYILNGSPYMRSGNYDTILDNILHIMLQPEQQKEAWDNLNLMHVTEMLQDGGVYFFSFATTDKNGRAFQKQMQYSYLDENKDTVFFCMSDVSKQYENEHRQIAALEAAKFEADRANEAKSAFLSSMSHDLRTPLNGILGFTDLAINETDQGKKQDYLQKIKYSGALLLNLVNDTLELSRIESGKMSIDAAAVRSNEIWDSVLTAIKPNAELKDIEIKTDIETPKDEVIWADRLKLQKIFLNLLSNAIKFTPKGGTVSINVTDAAPNNDGFSRKISIQDTGIGMSEAFQKILFEPFSQEKRSESLNVTGTGLGLTIVKKIVDLMHGRIFVFSEIGKGTRFEVFLPVKTVDDYLVVKEDKAEINSLLDGRHVLLCEDNYLNTEIATILLKEKGMAVDNAINGKEGLELFKKSETGYYDVILMDIRMPVMDGYEAAGSIRALDRADASSVPIIAMTADAFAEDIRKCLEAGMNAHIPKPIDPVKMFSVISDNLKNYGA